MKRVLRTAGFLSISLLIAFGSSQAAKTTLRISTWPADPKEKLLYDAWAQKFEKANPDIKVKVEVITGDYWSRLVTSYAAGKAPDVFRIACSWNLPEFASKKMIMALPEAWLREINMNDMLPAVVKAGTYKGKFYGWDPHLSAYALHYNKMMFDKAGIPYPDETWTWDNLALAASKLTVRNGAKASQWGFQCDEGSRLWSNLTWSFGGELFDSNFTKALYPNEASLTALQYLRKLSGELGGAPQTPTINWRDGFKTQKIAMILDGIWMNPYFATNTSLKHGTAVVPHAKERAAVSVPCLWAINAASKHAKESWKLLKSWCGYENSLDFTDFGGKLAYGIPSWKSAMKDPRWKTSDLLRAQIAENEYSYPEPSFRQAPRWTAEAGSMISNIMALKKDPKQAVDELAKRTPQWLK